MKKVLLDNLQQIFQMIIKRKSWILEDVQSESGNNLKYFFNSLKMDYSYQLISH